MSRYQFSLQSLLDQTREEAASEAAVAKAKALINTTEPGRGHARQSTNASVHGAVGGEELLASLAEEDRESGDTTGLQRIKHAMKRTEALRRPKAWYFFQQPSPGVDMDHGRPFPVRCCPSVGWQATLKGRTYSELTAWTGLG